MYLDAFARSLDQAFRVAAFISIASFVASWFIKELPMRTTLSIESVGGGLAEPRSQDSLAEIMRLLSVLVGRQQMRDFLERIAAEAGVDLPVADGWVLVQLHRDPDVDLRARAAAVKMPEEALERALTEVKERRLATGEGAALSLTPAGADIAEQLVAAVRSRLTGLLDGWSPEQYPEVMRLLQRFATELVPATAREPALSARSQTE